MSLVVFVWFPIGFLWFPLATPKKHRSPTAPTPVKPNFDHVAEGAVGDKLPMASYSFLWQPPKERKTTLGGSQPSPWVVRIFRVPWGLP